MALYRAMAVVIFGSLAIAVSSATRLYGCCARARLWDPAQKFCRAERDDRVDYTATLQTESPSLQPAEAARFGAPTSLPRRPIRHFPRVWSNAKHSPPAGEPLAAHTQGVGLTR